MTQGCQVLHALTNPMLIVDFENADAGALRSGVDKDQGYVPLRQLFQQRLLNAEGHHGNPVRFPLQHAANAEFPLLRIVVRRPDKDLVSALHRDIFEALDQLGKEWIGDLRYDPAEPSAAS